MTEKDMTATCEMINFHHTDCECATCHAHQDEVCGKPAVGTSDGNVREHFVIEYDLMTDRVSRIDGSLHFEGDCCQERTCPRCGAVEHFQGIYGGYITICEKCPEDADEWQPAGTYCLDCECPMSFCVQSDCRTGGP